MPGTRATPEERIVQIVAKKLDIPPELVPLEKSLLEDMDLDSFTLMSILLEIEEAFPEVTISEEVVEGFRTVRQLATYVQNGRRD
jgi:acyl carrier protein